MKKNLFLLVGCLGILVSQMSCAHNPCNTSRCYRVSPPQCSTCQCTDPGVYFNYCMDRSTYCDVFGNVGAR